jgi:hypothetical protein
MGKTVARWNGNSKKYRVDLTTPRNMNLVASVVVEAVFIPAEVTPTT